LLPADERQPTRPERLDQCVDGLVGDGDTAQRGRRTDQHRHRHVPATPLGLQQRRDGLGRERVGADAVDGVGGQHDELAVADGAGRGGDAALPLGLVGAVVQGTHGAIIPHGGP
jgi:hypothetical protein